MARRGKCRVCGNPIPTSRRPVTCSPECAVENNRRLCRDRKRAKRRRYCASCSRPLGDFRKRFCSVNCRTAAAPPKCVALRSKACVICEGIFYTDQPHAKCCSAECRRKLRRRKEAANLKNNPERYARKRRRARAREKIARGNHEAAARILAGLPAKRPLTASERRERELASRERRKIKERAERFQFLAMKQALGALGVAVPELQNAK